MAKKKLPKVLALLDEDMCTGCEACLVVCPVDCISTIPGPRHEQSFQVCTIDLPRCIGCTLCHQVDRKSTRLNSSHSQISYAVFCLKKKRALRANRHPRHRPGRDTAVERPPLRPS